MGDLERGAGLLAQHLPGHDVGVVLQVVMRTSSPAAGAAAPALRHQVDGLGGAAHEDDLLVEAALMKRRTFSRAPSKASVASLAERMHAAVHVGVVAAVVLRSPRR
jgi:hypothetical protein